MKKIVNIILASALLVSSTTSCSDFLQKDPPSSPSQSIFWQKKSDFQSALAGSFSMVYEWPGVMSQIVACFDNLTDNSICQHDEDTYVSDKCRTFSKILQHGQYITRSTSGIDLQNRISLCTDSIFRKIHK